MAVIPYAVPGFHVPDIALGDLVYLDPIAGHQFGVNLALGGKGSPLIAGASAPKYGTGVWFITSSDDLATALSVASGAGGGTIFMAPGAWTPGAALTMVNNVLLIGLGGAGGVTITGQNNTDVFTGSTTSYFGVHGITVTAVGSGNCFNFTGAATFFQADKCVFTSVTGYCVKSVAGTYFTLTECDLNTSTGIGFYSATTAQISLFHQLIGCQLRANSGGGICVQVKQGSGTGNIIYMMVDKCIFTTTGTGSIGCDYGSTMSTGARYGFNTTNCIFNSDGSGSQIAIDLKDSGCAVITSSTFLSYNGSSAIPIRTSSASVVSVVGNNRAICNANSLGGSTTSAGNN